MNEKELKEEIERLKLKNRTGIYTERIRVKQGQLKTLQERNAEVKQAIEDKNLPTDNFKIIISPICPDLSYDDSSHSSHSSHPLINNKNSVTNGDESPKNVTKKRDENDENDECDDGIEVGLDTKEDNSKGEGK